MRFQQASPKLRPEPEKSGGSELFIAFSKRAKTRINNLCGPLNWVTDKKLPNNRLLQQRFSGFFLKDLLKGLQKQRNMFTSESFLFL